MRFWLTFLLMGCAVPAWAAHGYALWGDLKYPAGFAHFDYVNPAAPKGGELRMVSNLRYSTFDKYNPFTMKGSVPAYLSDLLFETLLTGSMDETASAYGLLAEDVQVADDRLSATFRLRPEARFHNGDPVEAADVKYSYDTLIGPYASPSYATLLQEVAGVDVLDTRTVRFRFKQPNRELPLTAGGIPVFSRAWGRQPDGKAKRFDEIVTDIPIGSGPYRIGPMKFGRDITYERDPQYWGRNLNVNRGAFNFDRITVKIYKDNTARLEAMKAGEFDFMTIYSAGDWARRIDGKLFKQGVLVKKDMAHRLPAGFQSYVLNTRRPILQDVRVREALGLAIDYEWMNRQMFYGGYPRVKDLFGNTSCEATGTPGPEELALLEPWRGKVPDAVFGPMYTPPVTEGDGHSLRDNLRRARQLLADAGWTYRDGALRNAKGDPMEIEYLDSKEAGARTVTPWMRNLEKLGITLRFSSVDFALYLQRMDKFDYDMVSLNYPGTYNPGQAMKELFGSKGADVEGSSNHAGVKSPAVDALVTALTRARSQSEMLPACRALDRVIMHSHYLIPQWTLASHRVVYNQQRLAYKEPMPPYAKAEEWLMYSWWSLKP
ncbi:extracellular solute-binding protein [Acidovorax sp. sif1233]|uniref:extracellular solute-binding protein n=1 Tax=unclassified Acidovorax TaxID=2684926 RepID=UPI001C464237|nr:MULTISPECIES: extracellular solute-binding protein [unclassified Acidovorax]MBV7427160.1 extracellular solute-binding protein [Acidovorax sp. sif0732]MBV7448284.1 extracellular solute-binding protein [Acidovorax sp. sif0715]MBV7454191.1 extracellular solute-binding protein [Acidovorax sp. sif1233]